MFEPVKRKKICGGAGIKKIRLRIDAVRAWYVVRGSGAGASRRSPELLRQQTESERGGPPVLRDLNR
jgi:hypothetical protein